MKFTRDVPEEPGYYWCKQQNNLLSVAYVHGLEDKSFTVLGECDDDEDEWRFYPVALTQPQEEEVPND